MKHTKPPPSISGFNCLLFGMLLLVNFSSTAQSINLASWKLIADQAVDSGGDTDLESALESGGIYSGAADLDQSTSRTISMELPTMANDGMFIFNLYYAPSNAYDTDDITVNLYTSTNSTNGVDGTWTFSSSPFITTELNELQKIDISQSMGGDWIRVEFINNKTLDIDLIEIGLYEFHTVGNNNYFLLFGASIMNSKTGFTDFIDAVDNVFGMGHGYEPVCFNLAVSGSVVQSVKARIADDLALHPNAQFVLIHIGGNNVSNTRPMEWDDVETTPIDFHFDSKLRDVVQIVLDAGRVPILARLTFRDYRTAPTVDAGLYQAYGSLPYNWLIDDIIEEKTPDYFDPVTQRGYVDFYELTLNDQAIISGDGIHPTTYGIPKIPEYWANTALRYLYTGVHNTAIPYTEIVPDLENEVNTLIATAQSTTTESDIWDARIMADQLNDNTTRLNALATIDAIEPALPVELLHFEGALEGNSVRLNWSTAYEENNDYFTLEKSPNGTIWEVLKIVPGIGDSNETVHYEIIDEQPLLSNKVFYRLSQTDFDGTSEVLNTIELGTLFQPLFELYPNPASEFVTINSSIEINWQEIQVWDLYGNKVKTRVNLEGESKIILDDVPAGLYIIQALHDDTIIHKRLVISK